MTRRTDRRRYAILGVLAERGPSTGLDLCLILHRPSGAIYPDLAALEDQGRIVGEWEKPNFSTPFFAPALRDERGPRPRRRLYRLATDDERRAHRARREQLEAARRAGRTRPLQIVPKPALGGAS